MSEGLLDAETRKLLGSKILEQLDSIVVFNGKEYKIRSIIQLQARNLASFSGEKKIIKPFHSSGKMELQTYVIYDIEDDRIRYRISEICRDYGLERFNTVLF
jgi:hypothetical protein